MSKARTDAGLVESEDGRLIGILTDSDVSIKVAASGLSLRGTRVEDVMTPNPLCVREHERADKALALMAEKRARHLPLLDAKGGLSGMLDIAKVLYDAITRLEKTKDASNAVFPALSRMVLGGDGPIPTLAEALEGRPPAATARPEDAIDVAFQGLRTTRRSVLVLDEAGKLVGILSKSDVAKRALRTALADDDEVAALRRLRVRDVMTPRPDSILSSKTVLDALHKMHDGKYANMPILDAATQQPLGVVDVLDLLASVDPPSNILASPTDTPKSMPSLLEGFFAVPSSDDDNNETYLDNAEPNSPRQRASTADEVIVDAPVAIPIEELPKRDTVQCATISPATLKHSKGSTPAFGAPDFRYDLVFPRRDSRCSVPGDATYAALLAAAIQHLQNAPAGAARANTQLRFVYTDALATLTVCNDDTLAAATQIKLASDPNAHAVPITVFIHPDDPRPPVKLAMNVLVAAALAAALAFALAQRPRPRP